MMKIIGIVGGIGAGKSTVVRLISEAAKAYIINADEIGHLILKKGQVGYKPVVDYFGAAILDEDGEINRKTLGEIVFSDPEKLHQLNQISHPLIYEYIKAEMNGIIQQGKYEYIIIEAALLVEGDLVDLVDEVWGVYAPKEIRIQRIKRRNGLSTEEANKRISCQLPWEEIKKVTHAEINNGQDIIDTKKRVLALLNKG